MVWVHTCDAPYIPVCKKTQSMWTVYFNFLTIHMQYFLWREEEKKWVYAVSYSILIWIGENGKETGDFIMMLSSVIFFSFHSSFLVLLHPHSPPVDVWGKNRNDKDCCGKLVCYSRQKHLNIIGRGLLFVVEEWARAPTQNCVSRKIVVAREELCSCSTGRGQAYFLLSTSFVVFKELYVGGQVSHPYVYFEGKISEIYQY